MAERQGQDREPGRWGVQYPSGTATLAAYLRGGLKDLQDRVVDPWHGSAAQHAEQGMAAHPTPLEVYEQKHGVEPEPEFGPGGGVHGPVQRMERVIDQAAAGPRESRADKDPLDAAREGAARRIAEASQDKARHHSYEIG